MMLRDRELETDAGLGPQASGTSCAEDARLDCWPVAPARPVKTLAEEVRDSFACSPKTIPSKYFYDVLGSSLFEQICETPEYYPSRVEASLLRRYATEIVSQVRPDHVIELGSGNSRKMICLLDACEDQNCIVHYWPFDVCENLLLQAGDRLLERYAWLRVTALVGDYTVALRSLPQLNGNRLFVFLGGTLGNFGYSEAASFLTELRDMLRPGDALLLGLDRVKDPVVLHAAYNDEAGITAQFNLNVLNVLNRELGAEFRQERFRHLAAYNTAAERIEMYLVAREPHEVRISALGTAYGFQAGEVILTEISQKFTLESIDELLTAAGLRRWAHYQPQNDDFSLLLLERT